MGYAFISYSSRQQKDAQALRCLLNDHGIGTWMAPHDIPEGSDYADVVNDAIRDAACFVLVLTEDAQNSVYVDKEIERALHYKKTVAPIQLDQAVLNDSFSFYLCNQQIITVSAIDAAAPKMQKLLQHLQLLCNDRLPPKKAPADKTRDRRVRRQKISRLFFWSGAVLWCASVLCGDRYVAYAARSTHQELYGMEYVPTLSGIGMMYVLLFLLAAAGTLMCLYGCGLTDPGKQGWNPLSVLPRRKLLPAASLLCFTGEGMLSYAQQATAMVIRGLEAYHASAEAYVLPRWIAPMARGCIIAGIAAAVLWIAWEVLREWKSGFAFTRNVYRRLQKITRQRKRDGK